MGSLLFMHHDPHDFMTLKWAVLADFLLFCYFLLFSVINKAWFA